MFYVGRLFSSRMFYSPSSRQHTSQGKHVYHLPSLVQVLGVQSCIYRIFSSQSISLCVSLPSQQGQVDCWPLPCPPVDCEFTVVPEGECCPRCVTDPCQADTVRNDITKTCTDEHNISRFSGSSWIKHGTECTLCQCKVTYRRCEQ